MEERGRSGIEGVGWEGVIDKRWRYNDGVTAERWKTQIRTTGGNNNMKNCVDGHNNNREVE